MGHTEEHADIPVPPPLLFGGPLALSLLLRKRPSVPFPRWLRLATGALLVVAGFALGGWSIWAFAKAKENPDVWSPTNAIMTGGPYAYTRNPIYLAMALCYGGVGVAANSLVTVLSLPAVVKLAERMAVEREEAYLQAKFGKRYDRYRENVPRWL